MEEQRISMMYVNLMKRRLERIWDGLTGGGRHRRSVMPILLIVTVLAVTLAVYFLERQSS
jgi:hypothetical protein